MRVVYHGFHDGTYQLFRTDDDGKNRQMLGDTRPDHRVRRLTVFIEVGCEDNGKSLQGLQEGLAKVTKALAPKNVAAVG